MPTTNKVFLMGNLTRDPELRVLPSGNAVCNFGLAVNDYYTNKQTGQRVEQVNFVDCVAWGLAAESIQKHFDKGRPIFIEGRLRFEQWNDQDTGQKRNTLKVVVSEWRFVDTKDAPDNEPKPPAVENESHESLDDDDIPF